MFEDQTVELLPARTTMTKCGCGGSSRGGRGGDAIISQNGSYKSGNTSGFLAVGVLNGNSLNVNTGDATGGDGGWAF
jgi:hypothetical protein